MKARVLYRGYHLSAVSTLEHDGRYRARVAIMALGGEKTRSQRFLDFDAFASEAEADRFAITAGQEWIDVQLEHEASGFAGHSIGRCARLRV